RCGASQGEGAVGRGSVDLLQDGSVDRDGAVGGVGVQVVGVADQIQGGVGGAKVHGSVVAVQSGLAVLLGQAHVRALGKSEEQVHRFGGGQGVPAADHGAARDGDVASGHDHGSAGDAADDHVPGPAVGPGDHGRAGVGNSHGPAAGGPVLGDVGDDFLGAGHLHGGGGQFGTGADGD